MHGLFCPFTCSRTGPKQQRAKTGNPPIAISSCACPFTTKACTVKSIISYTNRRQLTTDSHPQIPPIDADFQLPTTLSLITCHLSLPFLSLPCFPSHFRAASGIEIGDCSSASIASFASLAIAATIASLATNLLKSSKLTQSVQQQLQQQPK